MIYASNEFETGSNFSNIIQRHSVHVKFLNKFRTKIRETTQDVSHT